MAWFNVWNYEMTLAQLNALDFCRDEGNLVTQSAMLKEGGGFITMENFQCDCKMQ